MAIYHLSVQNISRGKGRSAVAAAAYRAAEKLHDERLGRDHDFSRKQGVEHTEILAPQNAPAWATDRASVRAGPALCVRGARVPADASTARARYLHA